MSKTVFTQWDPFWNLVHLSEGRVAWRCQNVLSSTEYAAWSLFNRIRLLRGTRLCWSNTLSSRAQKKCVENSRFSPDLHKDRRVTLNKEQKNEISDSTAYITEIHQTMWSLLTTTISHGRTIMYMVTPATEVNMMAVGHSSKMYDTRKERTAVDWRFCNKIEEWICYERSKCHFFVHSISGRQHGEICRNAFARNALVTKCRQDTHSQHTSVQYSLFTSAERTPRAWLKSHGLQCHLCAPEKSLVIWCCTCFTLCCSRTCRLPWAHHLPHSLFLLPRHKNTQHNRYNTVTSKNTQYIINLFKLSPVDKQRHQESLWREDLQSGGSPRPTTLTGYEPKELATVSRIDNFWCTGNFGEEDHRAPITEEVKEFGEIGTHSLPDSKLPETSYFLCTSTSLWKALEILISKMESYKRCWLTAPLCAQKASGKPDALVMQEREREGERGRCTISQTNRKESLRSHSSEGQNAAGKPDALFSSGQGDLIRSSLFRNADPSNMRGSLLEGNKDHLLNQARSDLAKQELHIESLNSSSVNYNHKQKSEGVQDAQYGFVESRREQVRLQEELSLKEKVLRNTQIRNIHEMGEMKRAQIEQVDEFSLQKLRENHKIIQQLTFQL